jgi:thiol-disulfide isomerase/thioredoxin
MRSRGVRHSKKGSDVKFVVAGLACCLLLGLIVFGLLFLTGQNPGPGPTTATLPTAVGGKVTTNTVVGKSGPYEGLAAPDTNFRTIDGRYLKLSDLRGKYVVLWFMAAWCPSCATVGQTIRDHIRGDERVRVIVVGLWTEAVLRMAGLYGRPDVPPPEDANTLKSFLTRWGDPRWYIVLDNEGEFLKLWRISYVDTTFVIDPDGVVRLRSDGPITHTILAAALPPP